MKVEPRDANINSAEKFVANDADILINKPINEVYRWVVYEPLEKQLPGTKRIPGVSATKPINDIILGEIGHQRLVCLADGNTAVEEHTYIEKQVRPDTQNNFSYRVSDYTLKIAQNIEYALGEWWFTPNGNKTQIRWRYSFKLCNKTLLGKIGPLGRALFRNLFIKTSCRQFMAETLMKLKVDLEGTR